MILKILVTALFILIIIEGLSRRAGDREKALNEALKKAELQEQEIKRLQGILSDSNKLQLENKQKGHVLAEKENELNNALAKITQQEQEIRDLRASVSNLNILNTELKLKEYALNDRDKELHALEVELKRREHDIDNTIGKVDDLYKMFHRRVPPEGIEEPESQDEDLPKK